MGLHILHLEKDIHETLDCQIPSRSSLYFWFLSHCTNHRQVRATLQNIFASLCLFNIVPQLLLEFRYFIIPFIFIRILMKPICWKSLAAESCLLTVINFATIYTFLFRTFAWESEPGQLQRFMW